MVFFTFSSYDIVESIYTRYPQFLCLTLLIFLDRLLQKARFMLSYTEHSKISGRKINECKISYWKIRCSKDSNLKSPGLVGKRKRLLHRTLKKYSRGFE